MIVVSSEGVAARVNLRPDHVHITQSMRHVLWCRVPWARCQGDVPRVWVVTEPECDWREVQ